MNNELKNEIIETIGISNARCFITTFALAVAISERVVVSRENPSKIYALSLPNIRKLIDEIMQVIPIDGEAVKEKVENLIEFRRAVAYPGNSTPSYKSDGNWTSIWGSADVLSKDENKELEEKYDFYKEVYKLFKKLFLKETLN